jgi:hypothetical protein
MEQDGIEERTEEESTAKLATILTALIVPLFFILLLVIIYLRRAYVSFARDRPPPAHRGDRTSFEMPYAALGDDGPDRALLTRL